MSEDYRAHSVPAGSSRLLVSAGSSAGKPSNVHMTGSSAAVPEGQLPSKSLTSNPGDLSADALPGVAQRATSQRATSFVGTADYVAPEVTTSHCWNLHAAVLIVLDCCKFCCACHSC